MPLAVGVLDDSHYKHAPNDIAQRSESLKPEKFNPGYLIGFCKKGHKHLYGTYYAVVKSGDAH